MSSSYKMSRKVYTHPSLNGLTQGSIISGIYNEKYHCNKIYGCIITPRCDLAHGIKVPTIHYLPIIDLQDWLFLEGRTLIIKRSKKQLLNKLHSFLPEKYYSKNIFASGLSNSELRDLINDSKDIREKESALSYFDAYVSENQDAYKFACDKKIDNDIIKDLYEDKIPAYYLIEPWNDNRLKIILLREIGQLTKDIALQYKHGFIESEIPKETLILNNLCITDKRDFVFEIEAQILSPIMEHIMQRFAYNFTRIGVSDRDRL